MMKNKLSTKTIFGNPISIDEIPSISKDDFQMKLMVNISTLHPRQEYIDKETFDLKVKGKNHTMPYVLHFSGKNILIDGHHTVAAKKYRGQKSIFAMFLVK